jgi:hypothetical protein
MMGGVEPIDWALFGSGRKAAGAACACEAAAASTAVRAYARERVVIERSFAGARCVTKFFEAAPPGAILGHMGMKFQVSGM